MLIRFHSRTDGFTIHGDVGVALLRLMGMSGSVPGALLADDVPPALERLRQAVAVGKPIATGPEDASEAGYRVSLATRAFPLMQLLENAVKRGSEVVWEELRNHTG
ncbi:MAG TPA: DUF1840 domain-containing protein [Burkholderiales bacterium]|nr:DUF1840 domain-containing protein [Burkholderiales bacterium]